MSNSGIFCNTPWYEIHVYWDGSLGICCQEDHKLYDIMDHRYNIANMSIATWFNSDPVRKLRRSMLGNQRVSACRRCYVEEDHGGNSRRLKSNQKSVIFTRTAFDASFAQSPGVTHFKNSAHDGYTSTQPIDLHIDLGNYCNLACKMCNPKASSTIASQHVRWGIKNDRQYLGTDWTKNQKVWDNFIQQLTAIPSLNNIHLMGGETLLTKRFEDLVDSMIQAQRFDLCFSFVTNGTVYRPNLMAKLARFRRVGIEVSMETLTQHNEYIRQGTNNAMVLANIARYQALCNNSSITVTLRPAPSALSIGHYHTLLKHALEHELTVKSNLCTTPRFLAAEILPTTIKTLYRARYQTLLNEVPLTSINADYNASDPNNHAKVIREQAEMCLNILSTPAPMDSETELENMVRHCEKWDATYHLDARALYPEFSEVFDRYAYVSG